MRKVLVCCNPHVKSMVHEAVEAAGLEVLDHWAFDQEIYLNELVGTDGVELGILDRAFTGEAAVRALTARLRDLRPVTKGSPPLLWLMHNDHSLAIPSNPGVTPVWECRNTEHISKVIRSLLGMSNESEEISP